MSPLVAAAVAVGASVVAATAVEQHALSWPDVPPTLAMAVCLAESRCRDVGSTGHGNGPMQVICLRGRPPVRELARVQVSADWGVRVLRGCLRWAKRHHRSGQAAADAALRCYQGGSNPHYPARVRRLQRALERKMAAQPPKGGRS